HCWRIYQLGYQRRLHQAVGQAQRLDGMVHGIAIGVEALPETDFVSHDWIAAILAPSKINLRSASSCCWPRSRHLAAPTFNLRWTGRCAAAREPPSRWTWLLVESPPSTIPTSRRGVWRVPAPRSSLLRCSRSPARALSAVPASCGS